MVKVDCQNHSEYIHYAEQCKCGKVYPLYIAEGYQQGDVFVNLVSNCKTALFWHYSGFDSVSGEYDESFLEAVYDIILHLRKSKIYRKRMMKHINLNFPQLRKCF